MENEENNTEGRVVAGMSVLPKKPPVDPAMLRDVVQQLHPGLSSGGVEEMIKNISANSEAFLTYLERAKEMTQQKPERDFQSYRAKAADAEKLLARTWQPENPEQYLHQPILTMWETLQTQVVGLFSKSSLERMIEGYMPRIRHHVREMSIQEWTGHRQFFERQAADAETQMTTSMDVIDGLYESMMESKHKILVYQETLKGIEGQGAAPALEQRVDQGEQPAYKLAIARRKEHRAVHRDRDILMGEIENATRSVSQNWRRMVVRQETYYQARMERNAASELHDAFADVIEAIQVYDELERKGYTSPELLERARTELTRAQNIVRLYDEGRGALVEALQAWSGEFGIEMAVPQADKVKKLEEYETQRRSEMDKKVRDAFSIVDEVDRLYSV